MSPTVSVSSEDSNAGCTQGQLRHVINKGIICSPQTVFLVTGVPFGILVIVYVLVELVQFMGKLMTDKYFLGKGWGCCRRGIPGNHLMKFI